MGRREITILGATGSVGTNALDVIARHPGSYRVFALTARTNVELLAEQCARFTPDYAVVADAGRLDEAKARMAGLKTQVLAGADAVEQVASDDRCDVVIAGIVGSVGLAPTLAAVRAGKRVLLANKEALVMAGSLFMREVEASGAVVLPVDSEHNGIFQCLGRERTEAVEKIILTASGGPFLNAPVESLAAVTPAQACAHPNWDMGAKISVDSATLMNKGLEVIEACWLFGLAPEQVEVVVHPQSILHAMVAFKDGSILAQMAQPDMRVPIACALAWPERDRQRGRPAGFLARRQARVAGSRRAEVPLPAAGLPSLARRRRRDDCAERRQRGRGRGIPRGEAAFRPHPRGGRGGGRRRRRRGTAAGSARSNRRGGLGGA